MRLIKLKGIRINFGNAEVECKELHTTKNTFNIKVTNIEKPLQFIAAQ
jgi:hypothetical protein